MRLLRGSAGRPSPHQGERRLRSGQLQDAGGGGGREGVFPRFRFRRSEMSREHSHMAHRSPAHPRPAEGHPSGAGADLPSARCPAGLRSPAVLALPLRRALPLTAVCGPGPVGGGGETRQDTEAPAARARRPLPCSRSSSVSTQHSCFASPCAGTACWRETAISLGGSRPPDARTDGRERPPARGQLGHRQEGPQLLGSAGRGGCGLLTISRPSAANVQRPTEQLQKCVERSRSPDLPAVCCTVRTRAQRGRLALPHDGSAGRRSAHSTLRRASPGTAATAARPLRGTRRRRGRHVPCPHRPYESDALKLP